MFAHALGYSVPSPQKATHCQEQKRRVETPGVLRPRFQKGQFPKAAAATAAAAASSSFRSGLFPFSTGAFWILQASIPVKEDAIPPLE